MTPPDRLVQAAAEGRCLHAKTLYAPEGEGFVLRDGTTTTEYRERGCEGQELKHPECALAAAFAALPECEEVQCPDHEGDLIRMGWNDCLAALAREFGEPT